jgi:DNA-binding NtrC family response regulator
MQTNRVLAGRRILVVEDEPIVAWDLAETLASYGGEVVGPAHDLPQAEKLSQEPLDGAVLDVNLGDQKVFPVADALAERRVPFCFVTGYGVAGLRPGDLDRPVLQKPVDPELIVRAVENAHAERR